MTGCRWKRWRINSRQPYENSGVTRAEASYPATHSESGSASYAGVSNFTGWQTATAAAYADGRLPLVSTQPQYSLLTRKVETYATHSAMTV
jgi:aryl-alcohol dehydrogenase-like predicted oxidoreductase